MGTDEHGLHPRGFPSNQKWAWPVVPARKLVKLNYGKALRSNERTEGDIPVYGTNGQCGWHDKSLTSGPGVILGRKGQGPLGVEWSDGDFWVIDTAYFVSRETDDIDLRYFYYLTKYIGLNHLKDGTSNPSLSRDTFGLQLFPLPSPAQQRSIVEIVRAFDDKIELNRRMNRTLEAMAQAIFKSWFVDFEPVKAKAAAKAAGATPAAIERAAMAAIAGRSIEEAIAQEGYFDDLTSSNRASLAQTAALFPSAFQPSELGEIPGEWSEGKLGEIAENFRVGVKPEAVSQDTPYVGLEHIEKLCFSLADWGAASDVDSQKSQFTRDDFLFGKLRPYFHKVCYPSVDGICSTDILVIRASSPEYFGLVGCQIFQPEFVEYANIRVRAQ